MKKRVWAMMLALAFLATFALPKQTAKADEKAKVVNLDVHMIGSDQAKLPDVTAAINEKLAPHGISVTYHYHDWGVYGDDSARMISSGEPWDLMFGSAIKGYQEYAQNGNFATLNELLEETPKLKSYIPETLWQGVSYKGKIFGVPAFKDSAAAQYWVIDKAVADKAGVDIKTLKTLEDLDKVLPKLKEAIADQPNRHVFNLANDGINSFLCDYEFNNSPYNVKFGTTKVVNMYEQKDIVDRFKMVRKWQEAGFINSDANQKTGDQNVAGTEVISSGQGWDGAEAIWSNGAGHQVVTNLRFGPILTGESIRGSFMVVNEASEHKKEAVKYLELVNTDPEIRNLLAYGRAGQEYEVVKEVEGKDGKKVTFEPVDGVDNVIRKLGEKKDGKIENGYAVPAYSQGGFEYLHIWLNDADPAQTDPKQFKTLIEQTKKAEPSKILGFIFDRSKVESEIAACDQVVTKYYANLMTGLGDKDVDAQLKEMNDELQKAGLPKVMEDMQKQIDEYLAATGDKAKDEKKGEEKSEAKSEEKSEVKSEEKSESKAESEAASESGSETASESGSEASGK